MLRHLQIKNFCSIREELNLSFITSNRGADSDHFMTTADGNRGSRLSALIGANGSGKTSILKSIAFVHWFATSSFQDAVPNEKLPLQAHAATHKEPTSFKVEFEFKNIIWRYHLAITTNRVLHESLYRREKSRVNWSFVYLFKRDWDEANSTYEIRKKPVFDLPIKEARKVRQNASLISTAAQHNVALAIQLCGMSVASNVTAMGKRGFTEINKVMKAARFFYQKDNIHHYLNQLLSQWDLGLSGTLIEKKTITNEEGHELSAHLPFGIHQTEQAKFRLPLHHESSGTRAAFVLLSQVLPILDSGGLALIDELESDLHPHMLTAIVDLFFSPSSNPKKAQLICTTHSHEILNLLHKEQIILVEKDDTLNTDAWRLDDIEGVRCDDNYYAKYIAGAYGAVPEV